METKNKILIVDDEEFNLDILSDFLSDAGYEIVSAADGVQGLARLEQNPDVSAIILDRMMPKMDGMEMLRRVKKNDKFKDIPVIMQTAAAGSKQILEGIQAGAYYYLAKPYDESLLLSITNSAIIDSQNKSRTKEEAPKQKGIFGFLESARFRFRTLEESNNLCYLIASNFPDPAKAAYGLNELMTNAIEHGNLGITYEEKFELMQKNKWREEILRRLSLPENIGKYATLDYVLHDNILSVTIKDEGKGFNWQEYIDFSPQRATDPNGRGIATARACFLKGLEYRGIGNKVVCTVSMDGSALPAKNIGAEF